MKKAKRWLLVSTVLLVFATHAAAVAPFKKVSIATTSRTTTTTTTTEAGATNTEVATDAPTAEAEEQPKADNATSAHGKSSKLTGIPQIDYIWDPNLPRELRGYNLSSYPFFSSVPPEEDIHFKCDGLHDGFYASIEHKCQIYHHCVYGIRHDFLCANFTAFDQRTFICHFASDVDCEGSKKYWNRNDNLYMATTTSTSSTTTTEPPPPTPRRRPAQRPLRPLRRPMNRRPIDDYYYEDEEYDDDYYEERLNRRRKQRPRQRKPVVMDYEDEYEEKRSFSDDDKPRRGSSRDRFRDEEELDDNYESDRRKSSRNKPSATVDKRKLAGRKPGTIKGRASADERRSFSDDRPLAGRKDRLRPTLDDPEEPAAETQPRRLAGRRRIGEKRPSTSTTTVDFDDLDEYEKPQSHVGADDQEVSAEDAPVKVKTTPKPLEEFVTPKAAPASVFARPRAPPKIARPVPINEKKKFQYPVQKNSGSTAAAAAAPNDDEEYYAEPEEDYQHQDVRGAQSGHSRRRVVDAEDEEAPVAVSSSRRRTYNDAAAAPERKSTRNTLRRPVTEKKPAATQHDDDEYDNTGSASNERVDSRNNARKRPALASRGRTPISGRGAAAATAAEDVDFVDDDYEERPLRPANRLRPRVSARKSAAKKTRPAVEEPEPEDEELDEPEQPVRSRTPAIQSRRKPTANTRLRQSTAAPSAPPADVDEHEADEDDAEVPAAPSKPATGGRPATVRVVKRPFLPSRGGSPYLPRGLQPVGVAQKPLGAVAAAQTRTTDSTPIDMGSTISGVRLLEHGAPILRDAGANAAAAAAVIVEDDVDVNVNVNDRDHDDDGDANDDDVVVDEELPAAVQQPQPPARTTLPPRSALPVVQTRPEPPPRPKVTLDELYENDYDVTLNDALNPTLKPLSPLPLSAQAPLASHHQTNQRNYASAFVASSVPNGGSNTFVHQHNHNSNSNLNLNHHQSSPPQAAAPQASHSSSSSSPTVHHNNKNNQNYQQQPPQHQHQHQIQPELSHQNAYQSVPTTHHLSSQSSLPLSQSHHLQQLHVQQQLSQPQLHHSNNPSHNYNSDSYFSSTDIRRRAIFAAPQSPVAARSSRTEYGNNRGSGVGGGVSTRIAQHFYDDFEY